MSFQCHSALPVSTFTGLHLHNRFCQTEHCQTADGDRR